MIELSTIDLQWFSDPAAPAAAAPEPPVAPAPAQGGDPAATPPGGRDPGDSDAWYKDTWIAQLPHEFREGNRERLEGMKDKRLGDVFQDYLDKDARLSKAIEIPEKEATPDEVKTFLKKMGIPDNADGYKIDDKAKEYGLFPQETTEIKQLFARSALTHKQAEAMLAYYGTGVQAAKQAIDKMHQQKIDSFDENFAKVSQEPEKDIAAFKDFVKKTMDADTAENLSDLGIMYDPKFVKSIAAYHRDMTGDTAAPAGTRGSGNTAGLPKSKAWTEKYGDRK
jgi:hypothetical protein